MATPGEHAAVHLVVMGVAGCGKSSLGEALARSLGVPLVEGDAFHPSENIEKMRAGVPLTDADRAGWLDALAQELALRREGAVLSCSALKLAYRDRLRAAVTGLRFVYLELGREAALQRVAQRGAAHIFPASLVDSQFAALQPPVGEPLVLALDALLPTADQVAAVDRWLASPG
ncbi:MAG TPA: gluconokinase [Burkholderiaceae bacterium]|jgi:gluconokinase|nr:gluconokinase [Burkholderiaceae bacterium]